MDQLGRARGRHHGASEGARGGRGRSVAQQVAGAAGRVRGAQGGVPRRRHGGGDPLVPGRQGREVVAPGRGPLHRRDPEDVDAEVRQEGAAGDRGADRGGRRGRGGGPAGLIELDPAAVTAFRQRRHGLVPRLAAGAGPPDVAAATCGIHAQVMGTTDLQVGVRTPCASASAGAVARALWEERSLVRVWCMRGTLHLLTPEQFALYAAVFDPAAQYGTTWLRYFEVTADDLAAVHDALGEALEGGEPLTRRELGAVVTARAGSRLGDRLASSWGELLKPAARRGLFVNGPNRGQETTYVRTDRWLAGFAPSDPDAARQEWLRRYLRSYGPASAEDYARWMGVRQVGQIRALLARLGEEVTEASVGGRRLHALTADVAELLAPSGAASVRLLPAFDTYVLGHANRDHLVDAARRELVYRTAGWISPTVLSGGRVVGTWEHRLDGERLEVRVAPFEPLDAAGRAGTEAEAERLAAYFGRPLS